ncbi:tRNA (guanosine(37)-N1)-methyltransferase TrmD [Patescibacteria group bacterium]|nr:tRNA (guanosine(37)-N1)-methyltransferase TrmD [Patescibacteria group bacterium]MBU1703708.1 tRNA (guanosine(37)-N1)-methyltransferase TrmD [Patescibacteria group bacterium]MBU1954327.1 tRNA (guanosine(37)-N1)-methyltransferase TrmD [Patescibacteria group bacterium]
MRFDLLTIFPEIFSSYLSESIIKRAIANKKIVIKIHDIRKYSKDKHHKTDDIPYGGGPGMVMTPQPIYDCIKAVKKHNKGPVIYLSPRGTILTQTKAQTLLKKNRKTGIILLCGRYEGIDQRIVDLCVDEELSIGKYILTGGELPAMVVLDVLARLIPGVLGDNESAAEESFSRALKGKKEYPHYTRPEKFMGLSVPPVLRSGHHAEIKKWRNENLK